MSKEPININLLAAISFYWSVIPLTCNTVIDETSHFLERVQTFPYDWVMDDLFSLRKRVNNGRR